MPFILLKKKKKKKVSIMFCKKYEGFFIKSFLGLCKINLTKNWYLKKGLLFLNNFKCFLKLFKKHLKGLFYGWSITLTVSGRGCFFISNKNFLKVNLGYSHGLGLVTPKNLLISYDKKKKSYLILFSASFENLYNLAFCVKRLRPVDSYKGRGVKFSFEKIKLKPVNKK